MNIMFKDNGKAIYLQIADRICDDILSGYMKPGERIPSVREYAASVEVNPNTVMRTYEFLSQKGIIFNKRGIGYFLSDDAAHIVKEMKSKEIFEDEINSLFSELRLLGISPEELMERYRQYLKGN